MKENTLRKRKVNTQNIFSHGQIHVLKKREQNGKQNGDVPISQVSYLLQYQLTSEPYGGVFVVHKDGTAELMFKGSGLPILSIEYGTLVPA